MALSCLYCGLSIEEAFKGVTYNAAKALDRHNSIGLIKENYFADLLFWDIEDISEIPYWFNSDRLSMIMKKYYFVVKVVAEQRNLFMKLNVMTLPCYSTHAHFHHQLERSFCILIHIYVMVLNILNPSW